MQLIVQVNRFEAIEWTQENPYLKAKVQILPGFTASMNEEIEAQTVTSGKHPAGSPCCPGFLPRFA
jgi:hypothetical protein